MLSASPSALFISNRDDLRLVQIIMFSKDWKVDSEILGDDHFFKLHVKNLEQDVTKLVWLN